MPSPKALHKLKWLIWLYFGLLIFEGALRKWLLPGLATPLLIIRDPVVIAIYFLAVKKRIFPRNKFVYSFAILAFIFTAISILIGFASGESNFIVTAYGLRTNFLHLPLIFLIPRVFTAEDVKKIGKWVLLLSFPMALLMVLQFIAPSDAFINRTAGGEGEQIAAALGKIRPPGTFSFATGAAQYFSLVTGFLLYGFTQAKVYSYRLLLPAGFGLVLALVVSGSRSAFLSVALVFIAWLIALLVRPRLISRLYKFLVVAAIIGLSLSFVPVVNEGIEVFVTRWTSASTIEASSGGITGRILQSFLMPFNDVDRVPVFGYGLGVGTNAGAALLTGKAQFLLAEGEWGRVILESGPILGLGYLFLRVALFSWMGWICLKSALTGRILPLLLLGACGYLIVIGQFGQPTTLGFAVLGGGLCLAARQAIPKPRLELNHENLANRQLFT